MTWTTTALTAHLLLAAAPAGKEAPAEVRLDGPRLAALKARAIGPAVMGGRIVDVAFDPTDPETFYLAHSTGGIFKTGNGGDTFAPVFDDQPALSVGAVAVSPADPQVVWAGTGEDSDRNSAGFGKGVFRSEDGGDGPDRLVPPGEYVVTLSYGKAKEKQKLQVTVADGIQVRYAPAR